MSKNDIKEVVLHVGLHKTGTSSIQSTLYNEHNNNLLLTEGILYPRCWPRNHGNVLGSAFSTKPEEFGANKFPKILSEEEIKKKDRKDLERFETTLNNTMANILVISAEVIPTLYRKGIQRLKDYLIDIGLDQATFKIMIYTRNPVTWATSWLQQMLKEGDQYKKRLNKLKKQQLPTLFQNRIGKFNDVFGNETVYVYPFEEARTHDMGMVGHFLEQLNVDKKVTEVLKLTRKNEGMSMFTVDFMSYINEKIPLIMDGQNNKDRNKSDQKPLLRIRGDKFDIPFKDKKEIARITEQDIVWLKEHYHIDYSNEEIKETGKYKHLDSSFKDIEEIYPILTKTLRDTLIEFMENRLIPEIPPHHKNRSRELITRFKEWEENLIRIDRQEKRLQSELKKSKTDNGIMYRELALFMEAYEQMDAAKMLMEKASLYRPNDGFVHEKYQDYKQRHRLERLATNK